MTNITIKADGLIGKLSQLTGREGKACVSKGTRAGAYVIKEAIEPPVDTGKLAKSFKVRALRRSTVRFGHRVISTMPYAGPLEHGHAVGNRFKKNTGKKVPGAYFKKKAYQTKGDAALQKGVEVASQEIERLWNK